VEVIQTSFLALTSPAGKENELCNGIRHSREKSPTQRVLPAPLSKRIPQLPLTRGNHPSG